MPDGIALYEAGGKTFLLTANEGDASEWEEYANITTVVTGTVEEDGEATDVEVEVLDKTKLDGLPAVEEGTHFTLGGRSFSLYEVTEDGLTQVFDSGSDFEAITAQAYPEHFNASNKNNKLDSRADAKGPEPESVTVNLVDGKPYAYVGLERIGGVMVYDLSDPTHPTFVEYVNTRDFTVDFPEEGTDPAQGDVSVEGMCVVPAAVSPHRPGPPCSPPTRFPAPWPCSSTASRPRPRQNSPSPTWPRATGTTMPWPMPMKTAS